MIKYPRFFSEESQFGWVCGTCGKRLEILRGEDNKLFVIENHDKDCPFYQFDSLKEDKK